ncbi:MAG: hypothetical protein CBC33_000055 [Coraliomargarita sp. TMED73]|mgnify:FL=1|nr:MAG: hypothetical protein CBC33_000055 [Coraliomargarita sp. TMED73]|tara:strand:- start:6049 stop:7596 length:1548 start_codon:yes stop_codon:yes gene_type:complete
MVKILDCTLRDGGYYTDWHFSNLLVEKYFQSISKLPVDEVEVGYVSDNQKGNSGLYYHLNKTHLKNLKQRLRNNQKICCMINAKEIKNHKDLIKLLSKFEGTIDVVRFAVDPLKIDFYLNIIRKTKKKIKKINFRINLMYLSKWFKDINFANKIINKCKSDIKEIALVDSYGSLQPLQVFNFFKKIVSQNKNTLIGCHFHNNCGLALANTLSAIEAGCRSADSTLKGMGRGAGNAETELLLSILKPTKISLSSYEFDETLEKFQDLKNKLNWGSSFSYSLSAVRGFSQSEMMDLLQKRRLDSSVALKTISSKLKNNKTINFKKLEKLNFLKKNNPILIGGSPSFLQNGRDFLKNLKSEIPIFLSGSNAFQNYANLNIKVKNKIILILSGSEMKKIKLINNKNFMKRFKIDYFVVEEDFYTNSLKKFNKNIIFSKSTAFNPLHLTGKLLINLKIKNLTLAFFDGDFNSEKGRAVMNETKESLDMLKGKIRIQTFTQSFLPVKQINLWNNDKFLHTN